MKIWTVLVIALLLPCTAGAETFETWLQDLKRRAATAGLAPQAVEYALQHVQFNVDLIELDRKQPETKNTLAQYVEKTVTPKRVVQGRRLLEQNAAILSKVEREYGVPAPILVALWGKESDFGAFTGDTETLSALATMAYEGRRRAFFEQELVNAIALLDRLGWEPHRMTGSWAGALGQCQFMPSNYLRYGVDGNRNGQVDLWRELDDVFPSMANLLAAEGWRAGEGWGQKIAMPPGFDKNWVWRDKSGHDVSFWEQRGVRFTDPVSSSIQAVRLYQPDGEGGPAYALYPNFDVLMRWNRSGYFATAVGRLADAIATQP